MPPSQLWELVRRLAHAARITEWDRPSAHSLRHTGITMALDAGVPFRDVQDYARHCDARTMRYDHSRVVAVIEIGRQISEPEGRAAWALMHR